MLEIGNNDAFVLFEESIKSEATRTIYKSNLKKYFDHIGSFQDKDPRAIEQKIIEYIISMKQQNRSYNPQSHFTCTSILQD